MAESETGLEKKVADCLEVLSKKAGEFETKQKKVTDELNLKISNVSTEIKGYRIVFLLQTYSIYFVYVL